MLENPAMYVCPKCARTLDETRNFASCPSCGTEVSRADGNAWIDVARVTNLAEAGFLSDELVGLGIDAQIHQTQDFSALTDRWSAAYIIRVPSASVRDAATRIREYLTEESDETSEASAFRILSGDHPVDQVLWRPVALVILAGVASFLVGQRLSNPQNEQADRRPSRNALFSTVAAIDRPFVTEPVGGKPGHRLQFDRRRQAWLLETDRDGDGQYDSRQAFHASGARW
jgi:hypothetical protein